MYPQQKVAIETVKGDGSASTRRIGARVSGMGNISELLINVVIQKKPKVLTGFAKRQVAGTGSTIYPVMDCKSHRRKERS
jgi:hypothetical protein